MPLAVRPVGAAGAPLPPLLLELPPLLDELELELLLTLLLLEELELELLPLLELELLELLLPLLELELLELELLLEPELLPPLTEAITPAYRLAPL